MATNYNCKMLAGKVAVVTASTDGIGLAIAERLGLEGAKVVVSSRNHVNVERTVQDLTKKGIDVFGTVCHVSKKEHREKLLQQTVEKYGGVDIVVSNAGVNPVFGPMLDTPESAWDKIFDTNVKASFYLVKEFVPEMEKKRWWGYSASVIPRWLETWRAIGYVHCQQNGTAGTDQSTGSRAGRQEYPHQWHLSRAYCHSDE